MSDIKFEMVNKLLFIYEKGHFDTPILVLSPFQIEELKRVVEG